MTIRDILTDVVGDLLEKFAQGKAEREAASLTQNDIQRFFDNPGKELKEYALRAALEAMGLVIESGPVNEETITAAILAGPLAGLGIEVTDLFNREALIAALKKIAIGKAGDALGLSGVSSVAGLRDSVRGLLADEIGRQLASEAGSLIAGSPVAPLIAAAIKRRNPDWNEPTDFTKKGIANRERQAKWRREHTKHWEQR